MGARNQDGGPIFEVGRVGMGRRGVYGRFVGRGDGGDEAVGGREGLIGLGTIL